MTRTLTRYFSVLLWVFVASACSAQSKAPSDQVIEGVFEITNEWQVILSAQKTISSLNQKL